MREVFVSYASADQAIANRLVQALEKRGLPCWIASREIPAGVNYQSEIPGAIAACTIFLLLYSRQAAANPHEIEKEMSLARRLRKPFIPVRLDDSAPDGAFLFELATTQYLDMFPDFEASLHTLSLQLAVLVAKGGEVEQRARRLARLRAVRMWSFRAALVVLACWGAFMAPKAASVLHAMTHGPAPPAQPAMPPAQAAAAVPPPSEAEQRASGFTEHYYAMFGAAAGTWAQYLNTAVTDPVRYFAQSVSRAKMVDMHRRYAARWPIRSFAVRADTMSVACNLDANFCTVTGIDDYELHRSARSPAVFGAERFSLQLSNRPGAVMQLMAITSTPVDRP